MMHHLQRDALNELAHAERLRYADLNTHDLDGNVFTYHVKQLLSSGYIAQNSDKTYSLTQTGRTYVVHRQEDKDLQAHSIFLVIIRHNDKILMRKRLVQPTLGYTGFIHGEPSADTELTTKIQTRVQAKTGIKLDELVIHSSGLVRLEKDGSLQSYSHVILTVGTTPNTNLPIEKDETGENFWISLAELPHLKQLIPSCIDLIEISKASPRWFELSYRI